MKKTAKILSLLMVVCMLLTSCAQGGANAGNVDKITNENGVESNAKPENDVVNNVIPSNKTENGSDTDRDENGWLSSVTQNGATPEKGSYNEGVALVKYDGELDESMLAELDLVSATPLYVGSTWYTVELKEGADTVETVNYLRELDRFDGVDYDYIMNTGADTSSVDVSGNPDYASQSNHKPHKIPEGWEEVKKNGKHPGGSPDVIVAVIDTGVDYNHLDLRNNIWVNSAEIPDNGKDDDGNGYIDDVYGWDCVGNDNDPMDDNGHGTHVAGIIAAENNKIGGVGVAYNCKVMVLKAGNSSGYFNNSDIAEAVQYAYMNGASVINMSFGGSNISVAVEEALMNAYNSCVLVAAAGNDSLCNQPGCPDHFMTAVPFYPASLTYVIGVMSCDATGSYQSSFSNFDHWSFNKYEYDVHACGENILSTWPNNKYASLSGTSMSSPTVAGIAAVLRATFSDREMYSTKFITAQIVSTASRTNNLGVANLYEAVTETPAPFIYNIYDQYIFDNVEFSPKNNGNGVIDAGETIRLAIELINRGGMASNVVAKIDTIRNDDPNLTDPYFNIVKDTIEFSDIGTYSVRDCGKIYDSDGNWIGTEKYFEIVVSESCPNSYLANFNFCVTYNNGLDEKDDTAYKSIGSLLCNVNRGYHLSGTIAEDTVFEADRLYIVSSDVMIPAGITVTFKEGCQIQFYDNREYYNTPVITVYGTLNFEGTAENMIKLAPDDHHENFVCEIKVPEGGVVNADYLDSNNLFTYKSKGDSSLMPEAYFSNSQFKVSHKSGGDPAFYGYYAGVVDRNYSLGTMAQLFENCYVEMMGWNRFAYASRVNNCFIMVDTGSFGWMDIYLSATNNVFFSQDISEMELGNQCIAFSKKDTTAIVENNIFYSFDDTNPRNLVGLQKTTTTVDTCVVNYQSNTFSKGYQKYASQVIKDYYDSTGNPTVDVYGSLADASLLWPYVVSVEMFDADGNPITTVGKEVIKVRVTFNRPMDKNAGTFLTFGTVEPYADYRIDGKYVSDTVWEGTYTLKAQIENGQNFLKVNSAWAAEDQTKTVFGEYQLHEFTIDTTAAMAMNLQAIAKENGIELTFAQDDYDTILGYNIYRATEKDGNYVKLNPAILLPTDGKFLDENAEPGKTYWYTYTVVLTDFTESNPAGRVVATAMDTMAPSVYHTPVNQGYASNNLVISCTASDNVAISTVTLYYRTIGGAEWKALNMSKQSDKYSATVFGSDVTLAGLEYYIVASDGINSIAKGSAEAPYTVVVKDASSISRMGDVDGDGTVTAKDALMLMKCLEGNLILSDDEFKRADLNGDGVLSAAEALRILQYVNGKVNTLEM